jgi:protein-S-isoprenylcysteine O-methyltransferase Ste14
MLIIKGGKMDKVAGFLPSNQFFYQKRAYLISPLCLMMIFIFWKEWENEVFIWHLGLILVYLGAFLRVWAQRYCGKRIKSKDKGHNYLKTQGPYRFIRNPLYWGNIFVLSGMCLLSELIWLLPITILWSIFIYSRAIRYEEQVLTERFGVEYIDYCHRVPRWWPRCNQVKEFFYPWKDAFGVELGLFVLPALFLAKELIDKFW